jgi:hypothetical protein
MRNSIQVPVVGAVDPPDRRPVASGTGGGR